jgi:hypothetical protein
MTRSLLRTSTTVVRLTSFLLAFIVAGVPASTHASAAPAGAPTTPQAARKGRVIIRNLGFDSIRIEVRAGPFRDCERNTLVGMKVLKRQRAWAISSPGRICWRRERSMGQFTGMWLPWNQRTPARNQVIRESP